MAIGKKIEEMIGNDLSYLQKKLKKGITVGFKEHPKSIEVHCNISIEKFNAKRSSKPICNPKNQSK